MELHWQGNFACHTGKLFIFSKSSVKVLDPHQNKMSVSFKKIIIKLDIRPFIKFRLKNVVRAPNFKTFWNRGALV